MYGSGQWNVKAIITEGKDGSNDSTSSTENMF
jgi:hypothetical protein